MMTISLTRDKQLIRSWRIAYLATVVDRSGETPRIEDILIMREFAHVFLVELPGMPIERSSLW